MASILKGQSGQPIQFETTPTVNGVPLGGIPTGGIIMWSGTIGNIPDGWALCNGSNGTPNLQDRFIVGAGSTYAVGTTGGSADAVVVSHTHTASTNSTGAHTHNVEATLDGLSPKSPLWAVGTSGSRTTTSSSSGSHSHTVSVTASGVSGVGKNLPPYYALAYIMKL